MIYTKQEWYTPAEVAVHNTAKDCWVSLNGRVFDLTSWLDQQFRLCKCTKSCSCPVRNWYCADDCVEYCPCFKRGYFYCDAKRLVHGHGTDKFLHFQQCNEALQFCVQALNENLHTPLYCFHQLAMTIVAFAGKDVSHWFKGDDWVMYTHPITGTSVTYQVHGHGVRQPVVPSTKWRPLTDPWWLQEEYVIGRATAKTRPIRILNTLTGSTVTLEVCSEETIYQIMMRYLPHNSHMHSYAFRYLGRGLCLNRTLEENGIPDERDRFSDVALPETLHVPCLLVYYNDDLTEDPPRDDCFCHERACITKPEICHNF